jgi:hypothetical protein
MVDGEVMRIEGNTIIFKSDPHNYFKEFHGLKPCTIRRISLWSELKDFELFYLAYLHNRSNVRSELYHVKIINSSTHEEFTRVITDITEFEGLWVISWRPE